MQAKPGEAEIDRQRLVDLGAAEIEEIGGKGNGRRDAVADRIDGDGALEQMPEHEKLQPKGTAGTRKQCLVLAKPDVAPSVEIEFFQLFGQSRRPRIIRRG